MSTMFEYAVFIKLCDLLLLPRSSDRYERGVVSFENGSKQQTADHDNGKITNMIMIT